jgi:hypothetical protein
VNSTTYGFARFDDFRTYSESRPETAVEDAVEVLAKLAGQLLPITPARVPPITDWPKITECIKRGATYSLTIERPGLRAFLRFNPLTPINGSYEIRAPSQHRNEAGSVSSVTDLDGNALCDHRHSMLSAFSIRYVVITSAADRQGSEQAWRIGISSFTESCQNDIELL